jgi:hypothetical protein
MLGVNLMHTIQFEDGNHFGLEHFWLAKKIITDAGGFFTYNETYHETSTFSVTISTHAPDLNICDKCKGDREHRCNVVQTLTDSKKGYCGCQYCLEKDILGLLGAYHQPYSEEMRRILEAHLC